MHDLEQMLLIGNFHEIHFHPKDCEITEFLLYAHESDILHAHNLHLPAEILESQNSC